MKRFSSLFSYLFQAHTDIQPHLCCAPVRSNSCIRKLGDKKKKGWSRASRMEGGEKAGCHCRRDVSAAAVVAH